jgi:predicted DNA-binding ribbon-helix-helix protein
MLPRSQTSSSHSARKAGPSTQFGPSPVRKRSLVVDGRKSSVSLEDEFWEGFRAICREAGKTPSQIVDVLAKKCANQNVSSAIRVFVLEHYTRVDANAAKSEPAPVADASSAARTEASSG